MRKAPFVALCGLLLAARLRADSGASASASASDRLARYYESWFSVCPGTRVTVSAAPEIAIPGYDAYRVERQCELKNRNELSIALVDANRDEVFVGEVLYSEDRRGKTFTPASDLPTVQAALRDAYGLPVALQVGTGGRGALSPLRASLMLAPNAAASLPGFISQDGAGVLLGEFRPLSTPPERWRERVLSESHGVAPEEGRFAVTAFIDFQCEKCRLRTPQVRDFVAARGGSIEVRFLPLVKIHNWSFAAAESAAALSDVAPALYARYENAVFPRAATMTEASAREIAADIAEAAGVKPAFEEEIASGRARGRVIRDVELALRLGLNSTPVFFYRGAQLTGDPNLAESYIQSRLRGSGKPSAQGSPR